MTRKMEIIRVDDGDDDSIWDRGLDERGACSVEWPRIVHKRETKRNQ